MTVSKRLKIPAPPQQQKTVDGRFRIIRELGKGATGVVYEGIQLSVDRTVAVKVLHPTYNVREDYKERFSREAKAIARLNHTNCITLYDFGYSDEFESLYMVMEFVQGRELYQITKKHKIELARVLDVGIQIADAITHAHKHGILHRDLKPENVLVTEDWTAKVLDFGMARIVDELSNQFQGGRLTQQGAVYGTPAYMSPEQCQGNIDVTEQTDIYSLGVMLFELVQGDLPFRAKKVIDILVQHVKDPIPPIDTDIPSRLRNLIVSMMAKRPVERPSSAKIVAETLRSLRLEVPLQGEERHTLDVSQEIQRTLLNFQEGPDQTGDGPPRSTYTGVDEILARQTPQPPIVLTTPTEPEPALEIPSEPLSLSEPTNPASPATADASTSGEVRTSSLDPMAFDDDRPIPRRSSAVGWLVTVVVLGLFAAAIAYGVDRSEVPGTAAREPVSDAPAQKPEATSGAPATDPIIEEAPLVPTASPDQVVQEPLAEPEETTEPTPAEAPAPPVEEPEEPAAKPERKSEPRPKPRPRVKQRRSTTKTEDGKERPASSTKEVEKSKDEKLPTIRFTY